MQPTVPAWHVLEQIAEWAGMRPSSVYNLAAGFKPWRTTRKPMVVRHLYQHGWRPAESHADQKVRAWLNAKAMVAQRAAADLSVTP